MNKVRRKECERIAGLLLEARVSLEWVQGEEEDAFDNLPEGFQNTERGWAIEECVDVLGEIIDSIGDCEDALNTI